MSCQSRRHAAALHVQQAHDASGWHARADGRYPMHASNVTYAHKPVQYCMWSGSMHAAVTYRPVTAGG